MTGLATERCPAVGLRAPGPVLRVDGVARSFGPGCGRCDVLTGDRSGTNRCPACGTVRAVRGASFEVGAGEVLGVVGESGSGKSTLLRTLHLEGDPDAGRIEVDGLDLLGGALTRTDARRNVVVMVHQNALAAGLSPSLAAESNVAERVLALGERRFEMIHDRVGALLADLGIAPARHRDPLRTFSGGMQQRVQLARALVDPPRVLLLDEPTTGLDPSVQADLLALVQDVADRIGSATVVVTHDLDVLRVLASRVLVLHHGEVVEHGFVEQILQDPRHPYTRHLVSSRLS